MATFDQYAATSVTLRTRGESLPDVPPEARNRLAALPGVTGLGVFCSVPGHPTTAAARGPAGAPTGVVVTGVSPGGLSVLRPHLSAGRDVTAVGAFEAGKVAVLGRGAAESLHSAPPGAGGAVRVDGLEFAVGGVIDEVKRRPGALLEVFVPMRTARTLWPKPCTTWEIVLETAPGAAGTVGSQAALAATPTLPDVWTVVVPPAPDALKAQVSTDLAGLYLVLAGMSVAIGVLSGVRSTRAGPSQDGPQSPRPGGD